MLLVDQLYQISEQWEGVLRGENSALRGSSHPGNPVIMAHVQFLPVASELKPFTASETTGSLASCASPGLSSPPFSSDTLLPSPVV